MGSFDADLKRVGFCEAASMAKRSARGGYGMVPFVVTFGREVLFNDRVCI